MVEKLPHLRKLKFHHRIHYVLVPYSYLEPEETKVRPSVLFLEDSFSNY